MRPIDPPALSAGLKGYPPPIRRPTAPRASRDAGEGASDA